MKNTLLYLKLALFVFNCIFLMLGSLIIFPGMLSLANRDTRKIIEGFPYNYISAFITIGFFMILAATVAFASLVTSHRNIQIATAGIIMTLFCVELLYLAHLHSKIHLMKAPKPPLGQAPQTSSDIFTDLRGLAMMGRKGGEIVSYFFDTIIILQFPWLITVLAIIFFRRDKPGVTVPETKVANLQSEVQMKGKKMKAMLSNSVTNLKRGGRALIGSRSGSTKHMKKAFKIEISPRESIEIKTSRRRIERLFEDSPKDKKKKTEVKTTVNVKKRSETVSKKQPHLKAAPLKQERMLS